MRDISYVFEKNKKYGIIGHSGSGKSSLLSLMDGSLKASGGIIKIDDIAIDKLSREDYIFSLKQFEYLFKTDFANNISIFGSMNTGISQVNNLLLKLNDKMKERITSYDNINDLSGGEKQIIAILRMLSFNSPIILLDEAFSSIDYSTVKIIKEYLWTLKDKIIIKVTHDNNLENLKRYDYLIKLEDGKII